MINAMHVHGMCMHGQHCVSELDMKMIINRIRRKKDNTAIEDQTDQDELMREDEEEQDDG